MNSNQKFFISILIVVLLTGLFCMGCNPKDLPIIKQQRKESEDRITKQTDEVIKNNPEFRELDEVCRQVVLPEDFKLVGKSRAFDGRPALSYYYFSSRNFEESDDYFRQYFAKNGWQNIKYISMNKTRAFQKGDIKIIIQFGGMSSDINYGINCEKLPPV